MREKQLLMPPEGDERPARPFRLSGFFSRPQVQKGNRNSIYIFVNGRLIRDRLIMHALTAAYHNLMPPAAYPFALLFVECDAEEVDVNVHPSKTEVRFRHGSFIHDFVRDTLRERLMESRPAPSFSPAMRGSSVQPAAQLPYSEFSQMIENQSEGVSELAPGAPPEVPAGGDGSLPAFQLRPTAAPAQRLDFSAPPLEITPGPPPSGKLHRH